MEYALPVKNAKQKICKSKGAREAQFSQLEYEGPDPRLIPGTLGKNPLETRS